MKGWQNLREERYKRMIEMGLIDSSWDLSYDDIDGTHYLKESEKKWTLEWQSMQQ